jgi:O-antigen/teichoic acid export membrane protein
MATNSQRVVYSTFVQIGARFITSVIGVFTVGIVTRYLGADLYGQLTAAAIFIGLISTFTDAGLGSATVREIAQEQRPTEQILGTTLILRLLIAGVTTGIGLLLGLLIYHGGYHDQTRLGIVLLSITILMATLQSSVTAGLVAILRNDLIVIGDILGKAVTLVAIILCVRNNTGFNGIIWAYIIGAGVNCLSDLAFGLYRYRPQLTIDLAYWKQLLRIAMPLGITGVLGTLYFRADGFLLSLMRTNTDVGLYGAAYKVVEVTMAIPVFFAASAFPILAAAHKDLERVSGLTHRSFVMMSVIAAPIVVGTILLAPEFMVLLGGRAYAQSAAPLAILMVSNYFSFFNAVFGNSLIATNNQKRLIGIFLATLVSNIAINLVAIPMFGIIGAAGAVVFSELLTLTMLRSTNKQIGVTIPSWLGQLPALGCALVMGVAVLLSRQYFLSLSYSPLQIIVYCVLIGGLAYTVVGFATKTLNIAELRSLIRPGDHG